MEGSFGDTLCLFNIRSRADYVSLHCEEPHAKLQERNLCDVEAIFCAKKQTGLTLMCSYHPLEMYFWYQTPVDETNIELRFICYRILRCLENLPVPILGKYNYSPSTVPFHAPSSDPRSLIRIQQSQ